ncbi:hypothetical protein MMC12_008625 [Toensbergia leucococca]|nr:hypothetical protein [Toensbergia leucococca]
MAPQQGVTKAVPPKAATRGSKKTTKELNKQKKLERMKLRKQTSLKKQELKEKIQKAKDEVAKLENDPAGAEERLRLQNQLNKDDNALTAIQEEMDQLDEMDMNDDMNEDVDDDVGPESEIASSSNNNRSTPTQVETPVSGAQAETSAPGAQAGTPASEAQAETPVSGARAGTPAPSFEAKTPAPEAQAPASVSSGSQSNPIVIDSPSPIDYNGEELAVITREAFLQSSGRDTDGTVMGYTRSAWGVQVLVRYGPVNAAVWKLESQADAPDFNESLVPCISQSEKRLGEQKDPQTRKWRRTQKDVHSLQAVAFHFNEDDAKNKDLTRLDIMNPERYKTNEKLRYPSTYVRVKWTDGNYSVETRTCVRRLWSKQKGSGDQAIYLTALKNQELYDQWKAGQRQGRDVSATPDPAVIALQQSDVQSRAGSTLPNSESVRSSASPSPEAPRPPASKQSKAEYFDSWCLMKKLDSATLEDSEQIALMRAWDQYVQYVD